MHLHAHVGIYASPCQYLSQPKHKSKEFFKDHAIFLFIFSTGEESSQPTKDANKIIISIFWTMNANILDTR